MDQKSYRYIYGPVSSWRLGSSLGIDPISAKQKICSYDCIYCQLGKTRAFSSRRRVFVPTNKILSEIVALPEAPIDYMTFSGAGEPTLAKNLGNMIRALRKVRNEKIAVITNASLLSQKAVRKELLPADFVLAKLDADSEALFRKMNRPMPGITFQSVLDSLKKFRSVFHGRLALQIMFTADNKKNALGIARLAKKIRPDEIQLNTPLRPCGVKALSRGTMWKIEKIFRETCDRPILIVNVYRTKKKKVSPLSKPDTLRRRGKT
jgi:wyosine [tRNA(Phe)-imidazoG37] synthetase (radical SAM superfamily)